MMARQQDTTSDGAATIITGWCTWKVVATAGTRRRAMRAGVVDPASCPPRDGLELGGRQLCSPLTHRLIQFGTPLITSCCPTVPVTCGRVHVQTDTPVPIAALPSQAVISYVLCSMNS